MKSVSRILLMLFFMWGSLNAKAALDTICIGQTNTRFYINADFPYTVSIWNLEGENADIIPTRQVGDTFYIDWIGEAKHGFYNILVREYYLYNFKPNAADSNLKCFGYEFIDSIYLQGPTDVDIQDNPEICFGQTYTFTSNNLYDSYLWSQGAVEDKAEIADKGIVWLEVTDAYGCKWRDSSELIVHDLPVFDLGRDVSICDGDMVAYDLTGKGVSYEWFSSNDLLFTDAYVELNEELIFTNKIDTVIARVTNEFSCTYSDTVIMATCKFFLGEIPTVITPNDDGQNDSWRIKKIEKYPYMFPELSIEIFDRWGKLVWKSDPGYVGNEFKGVDFRGRVLPVDSYFYVIDLKNGGDPITGHITVVR